MGDVVPISTDPLFQVRALLEDGREEFVEALRWLEARAALRKSQISACDALETIEDSAKARWLVDTCDGPHTFRTEAEALDFASHHIEGKVAEAIVYVRRGVACSMGYIIDDSVEVAPE